LTGKNFGYLTVIKRVPRPAGLTGGYTFWLCECVCGNKIVAQGAHLKNGHTKSCGCYLKKRLSEFHTIDLVGKRFGKLVVLERAEKPINVKINRPYWKCKCDCGNLKTIRGNELVSGATESCGCVISRGENKIDEILDNNAIEYVKEKTYPDLKGIGKNSLRFDYAIMESSVVICLIEYYGTIHYTYGSGIFDSKFLEDIQTRDHVKQEYCLKNNIPLAIIPYTDFDLLNVDYIHAKIYSAIREGTVI
jgi:hypothetical protein